MELRISVSDEVFGRLKELALSCGLSPERLASTIVEGFILADGRVYSAVWSEGEGIRLLHDWPRFSSRVFKIKKEEMK